MTKPFPSQALAETNHESIDVADLPPLAVIQSEKYRRSLRKYVEAAWHIVEPSATFVPNWHIDAICDHLQAVTRGEIRNLVINIPFRSMKSLLVAVMWPTWEWTVDPSICQLFSSYSGDLSKRDSIKCRSIIESSWYRGLWGHQVQLASDQNEKMLFKNSKTGYRLSTSVGGRSTGEGGDRIVVDDAHDVNKVESRKLMQSVLDWWDLAMSTRGNDARTVCKLVVGQRVAENDLSGHVIAQGGYEHLVIPMEYGRGPTMVDFGDGAGEIEVGITSIGLNDPRTEPEELLWNRVGPDENKEYRRRLGSGYDGQANQNPTPKEGLMFKVDQFRIVPYAPDELPTRLQLGRGWDKASTKDGGDYSVGVKMGRLKNGDIIIYHVIRGQWKGAVREDKMREAAEMDGLLCTVVLEQEPAAAGKDAADASVTHLQGYSVSVDRVTGDKASRAQTLATQVEWGHVILVAGPWVKDFIEECRKFPKGTHDDQVDAASVVFRWLTQKKSRAGVWGSRAA